MGPKASILSKVGFDSGPSEEEERSSSQDRPGGCSQEQEAVKVSVWFMAGIHGTKSKADCYHPLRGGLLIEHAIFNSLKHENSKLLI